MALCICVHVQVYLFHLLKITSVIEALGFPFVFSVWGLCKTFLYVSSLTSGVQWMTFHSIHTDKHGMNL